MGLCTGACEEEEEVTTARFPVTGTLDGAGGMSRGTVLIDRDAGTFTVRPLHRRQGYTLPLGVVATMVCRTIIIGEIRQKREAARAAKKAKRRLSSA